MGLNNTKTASKMALLILDPSAMDSHPIMSCRTDGHFQIVGKLESAWPRGPLKFDRAQPIGFSQKVCQEPSALLMTKTEPVKIAQRSPSNKPCPIPSDFIFGLIPGTYPQGAISQAAVQFQTWRYN